MISSIDRVVPGLRFAFNDAIAEICLMLKEADALERLVFIADHRRLDRSKNPPIRVLQMERTNDGFSNEILKGRVQGVNAVYECHMRFHATRGMRWFRCSCEDTRRRGREVGPCKHLLALVRLRLDDLLIDLRDIGTDLGAVMPGGWMPISAETSPGQQMLPLIYHSKAES